MSGLHELFGIDNIVPTRVDKNACYDTLYIM